MFETHKPIEVGATNGYLGYVQLVEFWGSDERIIESARMSTNKGFQGWGPKIMGTPCYPNGRPSGQPREELPGYLQKIWLDNGKPYEQRATCPYIDVKEEPGDEKLLAYLYKNKHMTPFEMCGMTIEVQAPIFVFREWHRHRTQSYNEMSARYIPLPDVNYLPDFADLVARANQAVRETNRQASSNIKKPPVHSKLKAWLEQLEMQYKECQGLYEQGLAIGVPKELARLIVPVGRMSRMRASANLRNWLGFLDLRTHLTAQWEIRQFAKVVADIVQEQFPRVHNLWLLEDCK